LTKDTIVVSFTGEEYVNERRGRNGEVEERAEAGMCSLRQGSHSRVLRRFGIDYMVLREAYEHCQETGEEKVVLLRGAA